jgi:hypothetical protein
MDQKVQLLKPLNLRELYTTYQNRMKYIPVLHVHTDTTDSKTQNDNNL